MSMNQGRQAYLRTHGPVNQQPLDDDQVRRDGVSKGRAMWRARHGERVARQAVDESSVPDPDEPTAA